MSNLQYIGQLSLESFNHQVIQATIDKCSQTHNPKILEAIKESWLENLNKRLNSVKAEPKAQQSKLPPQVREVLEQTKEPEKEDSSDDEFDDADVVSAERSSPSVSPPLKAADAKSLEVLKDRDAQSTTSKRDSKDPLAEPDTDISISDISDLDDEEPETNDLVIGLLDKMTRPSSKKFGPPLWKLKLKYGIMQVNNVEIPFDTLEGEFEF